MIVHDVKCHNIYNAAAQIFIYVVNPLQNALLFQNYSYSTDLKLRKQIARSGQINLLFWKVQLIFYLVFNYYTRKKNGVIYKNYLMTSNHESVGQISLMKVKSNSPKCWVFYEGDNQLDKYEFSIDDCTTIQNIISLTIDLVKNQSFVDFNFSNSSFEVYASRKNGKKVSDLPCFEEKQTILKTGMKFFIMKMIGKKDSSSHESTVSTRSIKSQIKPIVNRQRQLKTSKQRGCFCF